MPRSAQAVIVTKISAAQNGRRRRSKGVSSRVPDTAGNGRRVRRASFRLFGGPAVVILLMANMIRAEALVFQGGGGHSAGLGARELSYLSEICGKTRYPHDGLLSGSQSSHFRPDPTFVCQERGR